MLKRFLVLEITNVTNIKKKELRRQERLVYDSCQRGEKWNSALPEPKTGGFLNSGVNKSRQTGRYQRVSWSTVTAVIVTVSKLGVYPPTETRRSSRLHFHGVASSPEERCVCVFPVTQSSAVSYSLRPHGLQPAKVHCPWNFPAKNAGVGCHFLLY